MLVLSRRVGECVVVGGEIIVRVVAVHGNQVRLGIEAPKDVRVLRQELAGRVPPAEERAGAALAR
jgi:carbon storage regulator